MEAILNQSVQCKCEVCGKDFLRPAMRLNLTSVTEQDTYRKWCAVCDECRERERKRQGHDRYVAAERARYLKKRMRRRSAQDIIQEYNLKRLAEKRAKEERRIGK